MVWRQPRGNGYWTHGQVLAAGGQLFGKLDGSFRFPRVVLVEHEQSGGGGGNQNGGGGVAGGTPGVRAQRSVIQIAQRTFAVAV